MKEYRPKTINIDRFPARILTETVGTSILIGSLSLSFPFVKLGLAGD